MRDMNPQVDHLEATALRPIQERSPGFYLLALFLACVALFGVNGLVFHQWRNGLQVTGLNCPVFWGVYITNFVFFVGISHAGTLISAILRVTGQEWRRPITRMAEAITVFALMVGPINIIFDMGRPDRMLNVFKHPNFTSPLLWDVTCISIYFMGSITYLLLPMIPDIAILRDRSPQSRLYRFLAFGWQNTVQQKHRLEKAISFMSIAIIPVAISVHTVVSYVFAMTIKPMWHSTIFGPYFVVGAIYSGIAALLIAMVILRKVYHFEDYIKPEHFRRLGFLLLTLCCLWFYFTFSEFLTTFYGQSPEEMRVFNAKMTGPYRVLFWGMVCCMCTTFFALTLPWLPVAVRKPSKVSALVLRPILTVALFSAFYFTSRQVGASLSDATELRVPPLLSRSMILVAPILFVWSLLPYLRNNPITSSFVASIFVVVGMWLERYVIVVPTLVNPRLPWGVATYHPSWVEWGLTGFDFAGLTLLFVLFSKLFPMLPVWEMKEGEAQRVHDNQA